MERTSYFKTITDILIKTNLKRYKILFSKIKDNTKNMMDLIERIKEEKISQLQLQHPESKFDKNKDSWINTKIKKELDLNYSDLDFYKITENQKSSIIKELSSNYETYFKDFIIETL